MNEQIEGPLITKTEHLAGEKHLDLNYRWGEAIRVRLGALGWRELQNISATIAANRA